MSRHESRIMPGYRIGDAELYPPVVYTGQPNYPPNQITSIGELSVGGSVWRVHPGRYSSRRLARGNTKETNKPLVEAPPITWYDGTHLERLKIIATGMRIRLESGVSHIPDRVLIPDRNYFYAKGNGLSRGGGSQSWGGFTELVLSAEDVGMAPYTNSDGGERWSVSYLMPMDEADPNKINASRIKPHDIVRHVPGTEFLS